MAVRPDPSDAQNPIQPGEISAVTLRAVAHAAGGLATKSVARMEQQLAWFRTLSAKQRSWVTLVAQAGISGYVSWVDDPVNNLRVAEQVFGAAPRELTRSVSLRRTVELVRIAIMVAEEELPAIASNSRERSALRESLLRYSREIAFAAAAVYAAAAETRGAWDARVEAAIVDGLVRGEDPQLLASRAAALNWDAAGPMQVLVGAAPPVDAERATADASDWARSTRRNILAAVHGEMLVLILAGAAAPRPDVTSLFGSSVVVRAASGAGLAAASQSAEEALAAFRVAKAWPSAPSLIDAADLLPERVLAGQAAAMDVLIRDIFNPLIATTAPLLETLDAYLAHGGALEPAARGLFIHPNTMRYRLRRVAELTGRDPWSARDRLVLTMSLALGRLADRPSAPKTGRSHPEI